MGKIQGGIMVGQACGTIPTYNQPPYRVIILGHHDTDDETITDKIRIIQKRKPGRAGWLIELLGLTVPAAVTYRAKAGRVDPAGWLTRWPSGYV